MQQMLITLIRVATAFFTPASDEEAEGLHRFAPEEVTVEHARGHVWAAHVAAAVYDVDVDLVLAIDYHESHFEDGAVGPESGGRVSCGAMTPYPTAACQKKPLLAQVLEGTRHLAIDWMANRYVRGAREALLGYAGGYYAINRCRVGPVLRYSDHGDDLCLTPEVFWWIQSRIREARQPRVAS